jgi:hypothetical protein
MATKEDIVWIFEKAWINPTFFRRLQECDHKLSLFICDAKKYQKVNNIWDVTLKFFKSCISDFNPEFLTEF